MSHPTPFRIDAGHVALCLTALGFGTSSAGLLWQVNGGGARLGATVEPIAVPLFVACDVLLLAVTVSLVAATLLSGLRSDANAEHGRARDVSHR